MHTIQMVTICVGLLALLFVFYKRAWGSPLTYVVAFILFFFGVIKLVEVANEPSGEFKQVSEKKISLLVM